MHLFCFYFTSTTDKIRQLVCCSLPAARGEGLGGERGLSIQGPHVKRAHKDTRMNSHGCGQGPIENACVQGPEFLCCAPPASVPLLQFFCLSLFNFCVWFLCVHRALQSRALLWGLAGRLPMQIGNNWHALSIYEDNGIHHYKNTGANNSVV